MGVLSVLVSFRVYIAVLVAFLHFAPDLIDINTQPSTVQLVKSFEGPYTANELLSKAERLFDGVLLGPESLALHNGHIYTGLKTGEIVRITGDKVTRIAQIGKGDPKDGAWTEKKRGRTLGLRISKQGKLLAADAFYGLHEVDVDTGKVKVLISNTEVIGEKPMMFPDDLTEDEKTGLVYLSDVSTRRGYDKVVPLFLENDDSGRIIQFDPNTRKSSVFADGLHFPDGIQITYDGKALLVSELGTHTVWKYHLVGSKTGQREVFARLPGEPDNIRLSPRGGYWVPLLSARNASSPTLFDRMSNHLALKRILISFSYGIGWLLDLITYIYPSEGLKDLAYKVTNMDYFLPYYANHCMIVELNSTGEVVRTLQSSDKRFCYITEVLEHDGHLLLGSFTNPYLIKLEL